jgi:hypothetical protein
MRRLTVSLSILFLLSCGSSGIDPALDGSATIETLANALTNTNRQGEYSDHD